MHRRTKFHQNRSNGCLTIFKMAADCSQCQCPAVAATHDQNLLQNNTIALSLNSRSKSFCIVDKTVFGQLLRVSDSVPA